MKEMRFFFTPNATGSNELPLDEAMHALRVLRLKSGDEMFLMDGVGSFYRAIVTIAATKRCMYEIVETLPQQRAWKGKIHVAVAPTKVMDKIEWFCEKATEIGIDEISFLNCKLSERKVLRTVRIEKIIISAVKQSRKAWKPKLNPMLPFRDFVKLPLHGRKFIAHCQEGFPQNDLFEELLPLRASSNGEEVTILIGPEGDFSIEEVSLALDNGFESVSLGKSRLRTETAALYATAIAQLALRK